MAWKWKWWIPLLESVANQPQVDPHLPATLRAEQSNPYLNRPTVFEPALKQYVKAHRAGEPLFETEAQAAAWHDCRLAVLHRILTAISQSPLKSHLILRGSALMGTWFGDLARRPGDLDWVVTPDTWTPQSDQGRRLVQEVVALLDNLHVMDEIRITAKSFEVTEIWLYEKAPGVRLIVPWEHQNVRRSGTVQLDFVYCERMPTPPQNTAVKLSGLPRVELLAATPEQSLAWKIMWLATDCYAVGKDLYDAVLLAEAFPISVATMQRTSEVLDAPDQDYIKKLSHEGVQYWEVDWEEFIKEYPFVTGTREDWLARLGAALAPLFAELEQWG